MATGNSREAMALCKEYSKKYSKPGLLYIGMKNGFVTKSGSHWVFDLTALKKYLVAGAQKAPFNWVTISFIAKSHSIPKVTLYRWAEVGKFGAAKILGAGAGVRYYNFATVQSYLSTKGKL